MRYRSIRYTQRLEPLRTVASVCSEVVRQCDGLSAELIVRIRDRVPEEGLDLGVDAGGRSAGVGALVQHHADLLRDRVHYPMRGRGRILGCSGPRGTCPSDGQPPDPQEHTMTFN